MPKRGFTLIELMVVIAIICLLAAIVLMSVAGSRSKARDAQRLADVQELANSLELYANETGHYPVSATTTECVRAGNWIPDGANYYWSNKYLPVQPRDPAENCAANPPQAFSYQSNGNSYGITLSLENLPGSQSGGSGGGLVSFNGSSFQSIQAPFIVTLTTSSGNTTNQPISVTATFSSPVSDFSPSSVSGSNISFISDFEQVLSTVFSFLVTPLYDGLVLIELGSGVVHNQSGGGNPPAQLTVTYDTQRPHIALSPNPLPAHVSGPFTVQVNSTIALSSLAASAVSVTDGTVSGVQETSPLNGENYSFTVTPSASGQITVVIPNNVVYSAAGNGNVVSNTLTTNYP